MSLRLRHLVLFFAVLTASSALGASASVPGTALGDSRRTQVLTQSPGKDESRITAELRREQGGDLVLDVTFPSDVRVLHVALHNLLGRQLAVDPATSAEKGTRSYRFETRGLPNGPYFVVLEADGQRITKKIMLTR